MGYKENGKMKDRNTERLEVPEAERQEAIVSVQQKVIYSRIRWWRLSSLLQFSVLKNSMDM